MSRSLSRIKRRLGCEAREMVVLDTEECRRTLEQLRPRIGRYWWLWRILRLRARQIDGFFPLRLFSALQPLCRKPLFIGRLADGTRFVGELSDKYSAACGLDPTFDAWLIKLLNGLADRHAGNVLDIGSNQGAVAAAVGRHIGSERRVFAFEPVPDTAARAAATLALNHLSSAHVLAMAIGSTDEPIPFHFRSGHSDIASAARDLRGEQGEYRRFHVECRRLDSLLDDVLSDKVGVIKIDVEGYEPHVVLGARQLVRRDRPAIVFEYWADVARPLGWQVEDVAEMITEAGGPYAFEAYDQGRRIDFPPAGEKGLCNVVASPVSDVERDLGGIDARSCRQ
jgi:FkbM family methyltransferase